MCTLSAYDIILPSPLPHTLARSTQGRGVMPDGRGVGTFFRLGGPGSEAAKQLIVIPTHSADTFFYLISF